MSDYCPKGWGRIKLGEIGKFSTSSVDKKRVASELPVRLLNYMDVYRNCFLDSSMTFMEVTAAPQEVQRARVLKGDMFFTPSSETPDDIGRSAVFLDEPANLLHSYHTVRYRIYDNSRVDLRFRGLMANSAPVLKHYSLLATGSTRYTLSLADFESTSLCLPPLGEQRRIVEILEALDTAIHETEAIIAKLKAVKQGLLHDLLTRGIDANGELRPPQTEAPHLYKQSPLGWIPKEWHTSGLAGVAPEDRAVIRTGPFGSSLKGEHWRNSGTPVVTIGALGEEEFIESELLFVDEVTAARLGDFKLIPGDVVFSRVADVGRSVVVSENERGWIMSSNFMRISCDSVRARPHFLQLLLSSSVPVRQQLRTKVNSAGRDVANSAVLMGLSFPWPSPREQDEILRRVNTIGQLVIQRQAELKKLLDVKLGLMDDLLTSRVRVTPLLQEAQQA